MPKLNRNVISGRANQCIQALECGMTDVCTTQELRQVMLVTGGEIMLHCRLHDIIAKALGGGVHRVSLKERE